MVTSFVCTALKSDIKIPSINIALFLANVGNSKVALVVIELVYLWIYELVFQLP